MVRTLVLHLYRSAVDITCREEVLDILTRKRYGHQQVSKLPASDMRRLVERGRHRWLVDKARELEDKYRGCFRWNSCSHVRRVYRQCPE